MSEGRIKEAENRSQEPGVRSQNIRLKPHSLILFSFLLAPGF
jgi:hypothetical protein